MRLPPFSDQGLHLANVTYMRRICLGAALVLITVAGCAGASDPGGASPPQEIRASPSDDPASDGGGVDADAAVAPRVIRSMANIGDSISQGYDADDSLPIDMNKIVSDPDAVFHDNPQYSWVQGTDPRISSVATSYRLLDADLTLTPISHSGAELLGKITDRPNFEQQATLLVAKDAHPDLTWVLIGGNDICNRPKSTSIDPTATLYSVADWTEAVDRGLAVLAAGLDAGAIVKILSMPRVDLLYEQAGDAKIAVQYGGASLSLTCKQFWSTIDALDKGVCPIVTTETSTVRRAAIGARIDAYNDALAVEARRFAKDATLNPNGVRFQSDWHGGVDSGGTLNKSMGTYEFTADLVSKRDCFHPSIKGQIGIANMVLNVAKWE